jgi:hypothetical protein
VFGAFKEVISTLRRAGDWLSSVLAILNNGSSGKLLSKPVVVTVRGKLLFFEVIAAKVRN